MSLERTVPWQLALTEPTGLAEGLLRQATSGGGGVSAACRPGPRRVAVGSVPTGWSTVAVLVWLRHDPAAPPATARS